MIYSYNFKIRNCFSKLNYSSLCPWYNKSKMLLATLVVSKLLRTKIDSWTLLKGAMQRLMLLWIFPTHSISIRLIIIDPCVWILHLGITTELVPHKMAPAQLSLLKYDKKLPKFINVIENAAIMMIMISLGPGFF